jgi:cobalt/nickel transport system permease protein
MQPGPDAHPTGQLHRLSPRVKLFGALALVGFIVLLPRRPDLLYVIPTSILLLLWAASRMSWRFAIKRLLLAEFFILGIAILTLLAPDSAPVFISAILKSNLSVITMLILTWTTPFQEILHELRRLRFPAVMATTLALMYRYGPVLAEESARMQRARASRTFSQQRRLAWENLSMIIGQLFIRSIDRAERIYLAMCARGWK